MSLKNYFHRKRHTASKLSPEDKASSRVRLIKSEKLDIFLDLNCLTETVCSVCLQAVHNNGFWRFQEL